MSWTTPIEHSKTDRLAKRGVTLVESADVAKYDWVDVEVVGTMSVMNTKAIIEATGIMVCSFGGLREDYIQSF